MLIHNASSISNTGNTVEVASVNRTVHITYNKIFHIIDQYIFLNKGTDPISSLIIEVPYEFSSNLVFFSVYGANSEKLSFEKLPYDGSIFNRWRIYLNEPLLAENTISIRNEMAFIGLTSDYPDSPLDGKKGHISFHFFKFPSSPYLIQKCNITIACDRGMTVFNEGSYFSTLLLVSNMQVPKNNNTSYDSRYNLTESTYNPSLSAVEFNYVKREIRVDLWGYLYIYEEHQIKHFGPNGNFRLTAFTIKVHPGAENIYIYDKFGNLISTTSRPGANAINVTINFGATRYELAYGESETYWVTYRIPLSNCSTTVGEKIKINLNILFGSFNAIVKKFDITLILPKDASLNYLFPSASSYTTEDNSIVIKFNETDVTPYNSKLIELEFDKSNSYGPFLYRPLLFLLIIVSICFCYVLVKRIIPSKERLIERKTIVPTPVLLEFCSLNEEKVSLITEIEQLEDDMKKRKIKKRVYRNELKNKEKKILELNKDIEDIKITLKDAGGRFAQIVNELEISEAERQSTMDGLYNLEQRYLRKKISIVAYQKLSDDLINRHKKAREKIDKLLFELREILS